MHLSLKVGARDSNPTNYSKNSLETLPTFNLRLVVSCYILNTKCLSFCCNFALGMHMNFVLITM